MTTLQVAYHQVLEQARHNREVERETARSNQVKELETARSNVAQEGLKGSENATKWIDAINRVLYGGRGILGTVVDIGKVFTGLTGKK